MNRKVGSFLPPGCFKQTLQAFTMSFHVLLTDYATFLFTMFFCSCGSTRGVWQSLSMMTLLCPCPSMIPRLLRLLLCEIMKWDDDHLRRHAGVWWRWSWWWTWSLPSSILWRIPILLSQVTFYHMWWIIHLFVCELREQLQVALLKGVGLAHHNPQVPRQSDLGNLTNHNVKSAS